MPNCDDPCTEEQQEPRDIVEDVQVAAPYGPAEGPVDLRVPIGLKLLMALIDGSRSPLHVCGDEGIGRDATLFGALDGGTWRYEAIDPGPAPDIPSDPPDYPGIGISAFGCEMKCSYLIVGELGADVIVGRIDGQRHILRVVGSASTTPLFGVDETCRCCGGVVRGKRLKARIIAIDPPDCGPYPVCHEFTIDPIAEACGPVNPLRLTLTCNASIDSELEDASDWSATACGTPIEVVDVACCARTECGEGTGTGSGSGTGSGTGTGTGTANCRLEVIVNTGVLGAGTCDQCPECEGCRYTLLIYAEDENLCEFAPDIPIEEVKAEACGLPDLAAGDRVILIRMPHLAQLSETGDVIDWFIIRACSSQACESPCGEEDIGPPCCGIACSRMPDVLQVTVEVIAGAEGGCSGSGTFLIHKDPNCDGAADTRWDLLLPVPDGTLCAGFDADGFPVWIDIDQFQMICGLGAEPSFGINFAGELDSGSVGSTTASCDPLFATFEITGIFCFAAGAGTSSLVTLRFSVSE